MGNCNNAAVFWLTTLVVLAAAATTPLIAHAQLLPPGRRSGMAVTGQLCCTATGNCPGGQGVAGADVKLTCYPSSAAVRSGQIIVQNSTDGGGYFRILVPGAEGLILRYERPIPCFVTVNLPLMAAGGGAQVCAALSTTSGTLFSSVELSRTLDRVITTGFFRAL
ncbi:hypothetical protein ABFS83_11G018600 [Erythranthe nasuta]